MLIARQTNSEFHTFAKPRALAAIIGSPYRKSCMQIDWLKTKNTLRNNNIISMIIFKLITKLLSAFFLLFIISIISCHNPAPNKTLIVSSNDKTLVDTSFSGVIKDSSNLASSKNLQVKIKAILGLWHLTKFIMIDKNGGKTELSQSETTMEFFDKMNWISHTSGITAEGIWDYNNNSNILTTSSEKLNGTLLGSKIIQKNKVIYLSSNNMIYLYDDPVTAATLEMHYRK